jgi:hypothetical protein
MNRTEILNNISKQKHGRLFNEVFSMKNRAEMLETALDNTIKQLSIQSVSQQRELLIAYEKQLYSFDEWVLVEKQCIEDIDTYLSK